MGGTALDSSVVVAALASWHERHDAALAALQEALASDAGAIVPRHALVESYSVLTRLPRPHRLRAEDALALLRRTFEGRARLVGLGGEALWEVLERMATRGVTGGTAYDAVILECALGATADRLLTLNPRHFRRVAPEGFLVVEPV